VLKEKTDVEYGQISAIVFQDDGWWAAQCLEYDLAAQARTLSDLRYELQRVIATHVAASDELGQEPFETLKPAPQKYWDMYMAAQIRLEADDLPFRLPTGTTQIVMTPKMKLAEQRETAS
jgi:predicted RNase H-like HicB family nuclease